MTRLTVGNLMTTNFNPPMTLPPKVINYLSDIGRKGGSKTSPAKKRAARANAAIGAAARRKKG